MMSLQKSKFLLRAVKKGYVTKEVIIDPHDYYVNNAEFSELNIYLYPEDYEELEETNIVEEIIARPVIEEKQEDVVIEEEPVQEPVQDVKVVAKGDVIKDLSLDEKVLKVKANKIELGNIYFQRSKDEIRDISYSELDKLVAFMKANPRARIRIEGHTDSVGDKAALYKLSMDRSDAIKRYLIRKGIHTGRVQTAALGASKPLNDNSTEELRSENRRVEFYITNPDQLKIE